MKDKTISLNDVIATIYDSSGNFKNDFDQGFFADKIRALPPVTPQRPTGYWIEKPYWKPLPMDCVPSCDIADYDEKYHSERTFKIVCDQCGYEKDEWISYNFCPNCGCRMVESQESEVAE